MLKNRQFWFFVLLFLGSALPVNAQPPQQWTAARSKNFYFAGDAPESEIRSAALRLEEFRRAVGQLFPSFVLGSVGVRTNVIVFKDAASYRPFKPRRAEGIADDAVAGYFQQGRDFNYITFSAPDAAAEQYGTVYHEYAHLLIAANFKGGELPPWLNEGLAGYLETLRVTTGGVVSLGGPRPEYLKLLRRSRLIPLSTLLTADNTSLQKADETRDIFYAESWALADCLIGSGGTTEQKLANISALVSGAKNAEQAARELLGSSGLETEKALLGLMGKAGSPASVLTLPASVSSGEVETNSLSEAEKLAYLGDLLEHTGRVAEAEAYLQKALSLDPKLAVARGMLGLIFIKREKYADARKYLEAAAADTNAPAFFLFSHAYSIIREAADENGEIAEFGEETAAAIEFALRRAAALKPDLADAYRLLGFVRMANGEKLDEAAALAKKAIELDTANDESALLLAQIYLKQEKFAEARDYADRLASLTANSRVAFDARLIVRAADEYFSAAAQMQKSTVVSAAGSLPPLILKRSSVSDAEIAGFEQDRIITNLNRMIPRPRSGERQVVAYVEQIQCLDDGVIYKVNAGGRRAVLTSKDFTDIRLSVITEGERTFQLECGTGFGKQLTLLTFRPVPMPNKRPELISITFVPDNFKLKSPEEMAKARMVVVEDDTIRRGSAGRSPRTIPEK